MNATLLGSRALAYGLAGLVPLAFAMAVGRELSNAAPRVDAPIVQPQQDPPAVVDRRPAQATPPTADRSYAVNPPDPPLPPRRRTILEPAGKKPAVPTPGTDALARAIQANQEPSYPDPFPSNPVSALANAISTSSARREPDGIDRHLLNWLTTRFDGTVGVYYCPTRGGALLLQDTETDWYSDGYATAKVVHGRSVADASLNTANEVLERRRTLKGTRYDASDPLLERGAIFRTSGGVLIVIGSRAAIVDRNGVATRVGDGVVFKAGSDEGEWYRSVVAVKVTVESSLSIRAPAPKAR